MLIRVKEERPAVSLVSLDWTDKGGVMGNHCRLRHTTYMEVSASGLLSDFRNLAIKPLIFIDKGHHENYPWLHLYLLFNKAC